MGAITSLVSPSFESRDGKVCARSRAQEEIVFPLAKGHAGFEVLLNRRSKEAKCIRIWLRFHDHAKDDSSVFIPLLCEFLNNALYNSPCQVASLRWK